MAKTTPIISFNLRDRGRQHTGQPRSFDIKAICDSINGAACQERVASRGMVGYYGHMPRIRYGMRPAEGAEVGGRYTPVQPALITTYLRADADGNIEHQAEFLDTVDGDAAARLYNTKVGGFSSAIDPRRPEFFGMDYVHEPNYLQNSFRGVVLDDVLGGGDLGELTYDDIYTAERDERSRGMVLLLDSFNAEREQTAATIERLVAENEQLISMLAAKGGNQATLDSAAVAGLAVSTERADRMRRDTEFFRSCALPAVADPDAEPEMPETYSTLLNRFSR